MAEKIRIGVINTSWWAETMFLPALQSHPLAETAAICGRNRDRAAEMAAKYHIPGVFTDYREMIRQANLDAVIVGSPDDLHHEMTLAALDAGLHVLCEKPLAMNVQQARDMYAKAQAAGVKHMVLFTYRWMPFLRYLHDLLAQGYVGRCYYCDFRFHLGNARSPEYQWRYDPQRANGVLGDLGVHMIDTARWLVGDITAVRSQLGFFVERQAPGGEPLAPANDSAHLLAEFSNGAHGVIHASSVAHVANRDMHQQVLLHGDAGSLEMEIAYGGPEAGAVLRGARSAEQEFKVLEIPEAYWNGVVPADPWQVFTSHPAGCRLFVDAIAHDHPVSPSFYDGYKAQQVIDAALEAHQSGRRVAIES